MFCDTGIIIYIQFVNESTYQFSKRNSVLSLSQQYARLILNDSKVNKGII